VIAIVGGTGRYMGARGTMISAQRGRTIQFHLAFAP
jgi:hypothetical protein